MPLHADVRPPLRNSADVCRDRVVAMHVSEVRDRKGCMSADQHKTARARLTSVVSMTLIAAFAFAACSGSSDATAPPTTSTSSTMTTNAAAADEAEVLAGYRAYWDAYLAAGDPMDPEHPALREHATGPALEAVQRSFLSLKSSGKVIRGSLELDPRVVDVEDDRATVRDCYGDDTGLYDAETGAREDEPTGQRHLVTATLLLEEGTWKVELLEDEGLGCTAS